MNAITVKQLNTYVKALIESDVRLHHVVVKGELSNFKNHSSGHCYFSLKYDGCVVRAVMFRSSAAKLTFTPKDGMQVIAQGRVSVFERDGNYQLYVDAMSMDGQGDLYVAFEMLKRKLEAEGLFDTARKRPLPKTPLRVGVITSPTGAAVRDIINVLGRRFPTANVYLYPVLVQGTGAAASICEALAYFSVNRAADVLIVGRGGGSIEDLWAFNEESVARAIADSDIPVISAVGHETDFTIADFVSDMRAPTPSAAAELAVPDTRSLMNKFDNVTARLKLLLTSNVTQRRQQLTYLTEHSTLRHPEKLLDERRLVVDHLCMNMCNQMQLKYAADKGRFNTVVAKLDSLSPLSVLSRGFSVMKSDEGQIIKSATQLSIGQQLQVNLADGQTDIEVLSIHLSEDNDHE